LSKEVGRATSDQARPVQDARVDEAEARKLAEKHGLPEIEIDAALYGESVELAESILSWIDAEEDKLTKAHGLIAGRKLYKPVRMLRSYARKYGTGRRNTNRNSGVPA
jgi:hypothetical protein